MLTSRNPQRPEAAGGQRVRDYVPVDDGQEPTDYDEYVDYPAQTDKDLAARFYVTYVTPDGDPKRFARLLQQQNAAVMDLLRWARDRHRAPEQERQPDPD